MSEQNPRLFLVDGSAYIFRAFFAIPPMYNSARQPTNAIFGVANTLLKFLKQHNPEYVAVALDAGRDNFRNRLFTAYKSNRPEPPAALVAQFSYFRRVLEGLGVSVIELPNYEADDIIATLCRILAGNGCDLIVVSSDKDLMQLVGDGIKLLDGASNRWIGAAEVKFKFGVAPEQVVQVMGLMGDPVDNIPGVKGIGAKTAGALIRQFGTLENLFDRLDQVEKSNLRNGARVRKFLDEGRDAAFLSRELATVKRDVPIVVELDQLKFTGFDRNKLRTVWTELEFTNLIKLLDNGRV